MPTSWSAADWRVLGEGRYRGVVRALPADVNSNADAEASGTPWILAGDFNALPPGDRAQRLPRPDLYPESNSPLQPLFDRFFTPVPPDDLAANPSRWGTYLPFGASKPDRTLDYVFHGRAVESMGFDVLTQHEPPSDHLPLLFTYRVPPVNKRR